MNQQMAILIATTVIAAATAVILVTRKDLCEV
ncbi:protein hokC [Trabulsiella odontotermitis]|uniref:Protein hokC n=1 Tax=Trabulsiella odontotermitis TaxID=379893 RepID=A0A0L0GY54_9ENTR|nr:protein hokC [Trabulsiella odontotermitis]